MERKYDFDLTYITERIISVFFPPALEEQRYRGNLREVAQMLKSKHEDKYMVKEANEINSRKKFLKIRDYMLSVLMCSP